MAGRKPAISLYSAGRFDGIVEIDRRMTASRSSRMCKAANALGMVFPPAMLVQADRVLPDEGDV